MKTLAEQIQDLINTRAAKASRMEAITQKGMDEGRSMEDAEAEEFDELSAEIEQIDKDLVRCKRLESVMGRTVQDPEPRHVAVDKTLDPKGGAARGGQGPTIISRKHDPDDQFEGQAFTRMVIARALSAMTGNSPGAIAEARWGKSHPTLVEVIKADVAGGGSGAGEWGNELVNTQETYLGDFQEFLYARTVYNQLPLREVPANILIKGQDGAGTGYWVGESKSIGVSKLDFNDVTLTPLKVGALAVISKELIRDSSPSAEMLVRDGLVEAGAQRIDTTFVSNSAAVAGTTPAGILNNIAATASAGTDGDAVLNDIKELRYRFITAKNMGGLVHVMNPALASSIGLIRNALDQREFPGITEEGGTLEGYPVVTGHNVNANYHILVKPSDIYRIGMGAVEISASEHASIEMNSAPGSDSDTPTAATGKVVGMFQTESMAIKMVQSINFARRRESAVAWINDADYGGAIST